jgi:hypothetical protein
VPGPCDGCIMLNAGLDEPTIRRGSLEHDVRLAGVVFLNAAEFTTLRPRILRPLGGQAKTMVLMAVIVAVTVALLLLLDHAGIHLPATGEMPLPRLD